MNNRGNTTIFLALMLVVMIIFVTAVIESGRIISSKTNSQQVSDVSLDSCFSKYAKELFDEYGVFGLWKEESEFSADYKNYVNDSTGRTKDILGVYLRSHKLEDIKKLTDDNGENFVVQVDKLMKYKVTQDVISEILLKVNGLEKNDSVSRVLDEITKYQDLVTSLDEDVSLVCERIELLNEDIEDISVIIEEMNGYLNEIKNFEGSKSELFRLKGMFEEHYQRLSVYMEEIERCTEDVYLYEKDYEKYTSLAEEGFDNMNLVLKDAKDNCREEIYNALETMVNEYDEKIVSLDKDYFNMVHCKDELHKLRDYCNNIDTILKEIDKGIKEDNFVPEMNIEIELPQLDKFKINYDLSKKGNGNSSFIETVSRLFSDGFLALVVDDIGDISNKKIDSVGLPSKECEYNTNYKYKDYDSLNESIRKILYSQYLFDYFTYYLSDKKDEKSIECEVEYIIAGKDSDKKNMEYIAAELVALREGFNFAYIVTDKEKMMAAEGMAASIVGSTGITPLISVTKWLIIGIWVTAESVVDVRLLLDGEEINLVKTRSEWNTDLNNLKKFDAKKYKNKRDEEGLAMGYKDYLRILLIAQNSVKQVYRTMDIIELNIAEKYNESFKLSECICRVSVEGKYRIKQLFNIPVSIDDMYYYTISSELSY
ncbi:MAG: hypothetical protein E7270_02925 [Lachnospiraceae bacterium]|nr:hypothetical protein [Lachnospiraceae bacterium]